MLLTPAVSQTLCLFFSLVFRRGVFWEYLGAITAVNGKAGWIMHIMELWVTLFIAVVF